MDETLTWLVQNVFVALLVGVLTGVSAGIVVSRLAKFEELRNETRRIVWGIDWIEEGGRIKFNAKRDAGELLYISSEMFALKHQGAAKLINSLMTEIDTVTYSPPSSTEDMGTIYSGWQQVCRELKPDRHAIFAINWKL